MGARSDFEYHHIKLYNQICTCDWASIQKSVQMEKKSKKIQKKPCMFNYSQKCIVSWTGVLNILGLVFNSESICVGFENVFLIKSLVNLMSNFNGFRSKSTIHSNATLKYFIFTLCATKLSTEWVFIRSCSPIFLWGYSFFCSFFLYHRKFSLVYPRPKWIIFCITKNQSFNLNFLYEKSIFFDEVKFVR